MICFKNLHRTFANITIFLSFKIDNLFTGRLNFLNTIVLFVIYLDTFIDIRRTNGMKGIQMTIWDLVSPMTGYLHFN